MNPVRSSWHKKLFIFLLFGFFVAFVFTFSHSTHAISPSDYGLKEGDLISAIFSDDPDVYIVNEHGYKRLFLNPEIFKFYTHLGGFASVKLVTPEIRDAFPTSGLFRNCEENDPKVYGFEADDEDEGKLRWINTSGEQAVQDDPEFFKKVFCINDKEFKWYKRGEELTSAKEVPQYQRAIPATPAIPAVPAIPASPSEPFAPTASKSQPLTPSITLQPASGSFTPTPIPTSVTQPAIPAIPATPATSAQPATTTSPTPTLISGAPLPPISVTAVSASGKITINWVGASVVDRPIFMIQRSVNSGAFQPFVPATGYTYDDSYQLVAGSIYRYKVFSCDIAGYSCYNGTESNIVAFGNNESSQSGTTVCSGLNLTFGGGKTSYIQGETVTYTYTCTPGGATSYVGVLVVKSDGTPIRYDSASDSTLRNISTITARFGTSYFAPGNYILQVCFSVGCSSVTTSLPFVVTTSTPTPTSNSVISAPTSVTASLGTGKISVVWSGGTASKYNIYRCVVDYGCGGATAYGYLYNTSGTYYDDDSMTPGSTYSYKITACDSDYSNCSGGGTISNSITYPASNPTASVSFDNFSTNLANAAKIKRDLYQGIIGEDVKQLQALLVNEVSYPANLITGYFGNITRDAVKRLQEKYGVKPALGYFGEITRKALNALIFN